VKLRDLADRLACRLDGDGDVEILRVEAIDRAGPGDLTFLANPKYARGLAATRASAVIVADTAPAAPCATLRTSHPYLVFARALALLFPRERPPAGIHASAVVEDGATIAPDASIGPLVHVAAGASIGPGTVVHALCSIGAGARIGADCLLHTHVAVREGVVVGNRVVLQDGVILGGDGFGFATRPDGTHEKIPQVGGVVIEDDVEIGANSTVDRPPFGETRIGPGTKIDNLVQIAHGVKVGRDVFMAAQVGIAGSVTVGDRVMLGGQVGVAGHLTIGDDVKVVAQSGIPSSVEAGAFIAGSPVMDYRDWLKVSGVLKHVPEMKRTISALQERLAELEARAGEASSR
jgi:UDP-3-O-[3-hydroxymyristoyl] glucosamine N-acyltransferase